MGFIDGFDWTSFGGLKRGHSGVRFGSVLGSVLGPFWGPFWDRFGIRKLTRLGPKTDMTIVALSVKELSASM